MGERSYAQHCGIAHALELVGDRWALLVVRELLLGPRRYTDLKAGLPKAPTNILSTRLKELQQAGVIRRAPLAHRGLVYALTERGRELEPVLAALGRWGWRSLGDAVPGQAVTRGSVAAMLRSAFRPESAAGLPPIRYELRVGPLGIGVAVTGPTLSITRLPAAAEALAAADASAAQLVLEAGAGLHRLLSAAEPLEAALAAGALRVVAGDPALLGSFLAVFRLDAPLPVA